ncbi:MAG: DUF5655 domain-containing protein [Bacteroidetes bacterium]|nr:DUF5655 domain-containing protein [Bacteroidota bacterium]
MSDIKLFHLQNNKVKELEGKSFTIERSLQNLIEANLDSFLGVIFLASEYGTGERHAGRIDTLGIDENNCPVILEYKRAVNENVMNQGLFYLDWLLDHKAEFQLLVMKKLGNKIAEEIEWNSARLICIAGDYTKYDSYAVQQIKRNIELIRYKKYDDLLLLELVNSVTGEAAENGKATKRVKYSTANELLAKSSNKVKDLFEAAKSFLSALGEDVQMKELKFYYAFRKIKNFASIEIHPQNDWIIIFINLDLDTFKPEKGFTRDVGKIGHLGTGNLEIKIKDMNDFEKAKSLLIKSYELN